jgi:hypothetical protein
MPCECFRRKLKHFYDIQAWEFGFLTSMVASSAILITIPSLKVMREKLWEILLLKPGLPSSKLEAAVSKIKLASFPSLRHWA